MNNSPRICVSIAGGTVVDALDIASSVSSQADVLEIRLDYLREPAISPFLEALETPLLFTNRPVWEGGLSSDDEEERIELLLEAVSKDAGYIDLELRTSNVLQQRMRTALQQSSTKLILSWHNFKDTPAREELVGHISMMQDKGATIGKIITTAHNHEDVLRVLQLQEVAERLGFPLITFCMGSPGVVSRVATCHLGGYMTYCAVNDDDAVAPGQLSVKALREIFTLMGGRESAH